MSTCFWSPPCDRTILRAPVPVPSTCPCRLPSALRSVALALALAACSGSGQPGRIGNPELISQQEIEQYRTSGTPHVYELIQRARPRWLESRGDRSLVLDTQILVYQNQQKLGGLDILRDLNLDNIVRIRRLDSARAGLLPGARDQHVESAIVIETMVAR